MKVLKVVIDAGIETPEAIASIDRPSFRAARRRQSMQKSGPSNLESERLALTELDRGLLIEVGKVGMTNAFLNRFDDEGRLHRTGVMPLIGKESIRKYLAEKMLEVKWEPMASDIARSADLGYTYGRFEAATIGNSSTRQSERGYYVRVWRRAASRWTLMLDTVSLVPPEEK